MLINDPKDDKRRRPIKYKQWGDREMRGKRIKHYFKWTKENNRNILYFTFFLWKSWGLYLLGAKRQSQTASEWILSIKESANAEEDE